MGTVAILTDYGLRDDYVGLLHASVLREGPDLHIVDLCHDVEPSNIEHAAFLLLHDSEYFPPDTVFVVVVDPGVGTDRRLLIMVHERQDGSRYSYVAPDNGLLAPLINWLREQGETVHVYAATDQKVVDKLAGRSEQDYPPVSHTFHGRDIFAPVAARLAGGTPAEHFARPTDSWEGNSWRPPRFGSGATLGRVMFADRFGNLITDIPVDERDGTVVILSQTLPMVTTFADIPPGKLAWLRGSKGTIEIVMNGNSAAKMLRAGRGEAVVFATNVSSD